MNKVTCVILFVTLTIVALPTLVTAAPGWSFDMSWSYANANAIHDVIAITYYPHAIALLNSDTAWQHGKSARQIIQQTRWLPGVKAIIVSDASGFGSVQFPDTFLNLQTFSQDLFKLPQATRRPFAPMMRTIVGGKTQFIHVPFGEETLSLLTRFIRPDSMKPPTVAISLVLDKEWLVKALPAKLDSLARESTQLLFWAPSPQNHEGMQALGVLDGVDTLWWMGPKNVKVGITEGLWPFPEIKVHTFVHWIGPNNEARMDSLRSARKAQEWKEIIRKKEEQDKSSK